MSRIPAFLITCLAWVSLVVSTPLNILLESEDITTLDPYVQPGTVVVFDLDDTLVRCQSSLGTSPWFYGKVEEAIKQGIEPNEALELFSEINAKVAKHLTFELIDPAAREMIRRYQRQGLVVVALTARPHNLMGVTLAQLEEIGVDFGESLHVDGPFIFDFHESFGYQQGVLFVSDRCTKEEVLEAFVDQLPHCYPLKRVVFADDKAKYLEPMSAFAKRRGVEFVGLRYGHEDNRKGHVSLEIADRQLTLLHNYLTPSQLDKMDWLPNLTLLEEPLSPELDSSTGPGWVLFGQVIPDDHLVPSSKGLH